MLVKMALLIFPFSKLINPFANNKLSNFFMYDESSFKLKIIFYAYLDE